MDVRDQLRERDAGIVEDGLLEYVSDQLYQQGYWSTVDYESMDRGLEMGMKRLKKKKGVALDMQAQALMVESL